MHGNRSHRKGLLAGPALARAAVWFLALQLLALPAASAAESGPFPLEPPDTSSPRATIESFIVNNAKGAKALREGESAAAIISWFHRADGCLDLSKVSPEHRRIAGTEASLLIYEVLTRVGLPDLADIPSKFEAEQEGLTAWTVPRTEITIVRVEEGERAGEYLFSSTTVARALQDYGKVKHLPPRPEFVPGTYESYATGPDLIAPHLWADALPSWAKARFLRNPVWKWCAIIVILALGAGAAVLIRRLTRRWDRALAKHGEHWQVGTLIFALSLVIIPLIVDALFVAVVGVRFEVGTVASKAVLGLAFAAGVVVLFVFFERIAHIAIASRHLRERSVNAQFLRVTARMLAIIASLYLVIEATEFLGLHLAPVLAGLGIGGLAVALAARSTVENIIGGFILFADKPVRVGDYCRFGDDAGTVEDIGLRSTKIRRLDDKLVIVPNAEFARLQIQNYTRRREWLYRTTLSLRYETTPEQLRHCLATLREMLLGHPKVSRNRLNVRFLGFGAYSLDIELFAYLRTNEWLDYRAIREDINLRIMDIVKQSGTGFAFPSQTAYLGRDAGLDAALGRRAETEVQAWRDKGQLPFPDFDETRSSEKEDSLSYPPEGSPDYQPRAGVSESEAAPQPDPKSPRPARQSAAASAPAKAGPRGEKPGEPPRRPKT